MYSRDYILKLVQQFAQVMARVMGLKEKGDLIRASELISEAYKEMFHLERTDLLMWDADHIISTLIEKHRLSYDQLEVLAKLMVEDASIAVSEKINLYRKSLFILEYLNIEQKVYSFEREELIQRIKESLN